jgi:CspA family cold shock protein
MAQLGTVKWFSNPKGFGFIQPDGGGEDIFCHATACKSLLVDGDAVEFDIAENPKKPGKVQAANVVVVKRRVGTFYNNSL